MKNTKYKTLNTIYTVGPARSVHLDVFGKKRASATSKSTAGFTLIEVMVSVSIFVTIMLIGVGAILNTNVTHKRTLAVRQVLDSVNFLVEDMARNIRLGSNYNCIIADGVDYSASFGSVANQASINEPEDCEDGLSIAFEPQGGLSNDDTDQMAYIIDTTSGGGVTDRANVKKISKTVQGPVIRDVTPALGSSEAKLVIDPRQSGFTVVGSYPFPLDPSLDVIGYDTIQPRVIIRLSGYVDYKDKRIPFSIQTTVTQRLIDS